MKYLVWLVWLVASLSALAGPNVSLDFNAAPLRELVPVVFGEMLKRAYVLDSSVVACPDLVSLSLRDVDPAVIGQEVDKLLSAHGFAVDVRNGVYVVRKREDASQDDETLVYRPLHRSPQYLLDLVGALFKPGSFSSQRQASTINIGQVTGTLGQGGVVGSAASNAGLNASLNTDNDVLIFRGAAKDVERFKKVVGQVDTPSGEVLVKAVVYEVQTTKKDGSAVDLAVSLMSGKLGVSILGGAAGGSSKASVNLGGGLDVALAYAALASDDRFKVLTAPRLRVQSGASARFSVGSDTPVLGSVSYNQSGQSVQSVEYKSSGVIFEVKPTIRDGGAVLDIRQQISQFVPTTTGVNSSPTLVKRELQTVVNAAPGEVILIGGLDDEKATSSDSGVPFLPSWLWSHNREADKTEIVLMLEMQRL